MLVDGVVKLKDSAVTLCSPQVSGAGAGAGTFKPCFAGFFSTFN